MFRTRRPSRRGDEPTAAAGAPKAPPRQPPNLAARMGRWSAAHWKTATFGWLAFVLVAFALGAMVGMKSIDQNAPGPGESGRMQKILDDGFKQPAGESVLIQSRSRRVGDPGFTAAIRDVVARVSKVAAVQHVRKGQISKDGHAALVEFDIRGDKDKAVDKIEPVLDNVAAAQRAHPGFVDRRVRRRERAEGSRDGVRRRPRQGRDALAADHAGHPRAHVRRARGGGHSAAARADRRLRDVRADRAAQPPRAGGDARRQAMVLLIGLAVGVDYSMFYLKRARQERAAGRSERAALEAAAATSGRSVLISGLTVIVGDGRHVSHRRPDVRLARLRHDPRRRRRGARLADRAARRCSRRLGDKVDRLRVPFVGRLRRDDGEGRIWGAIVDRVLRRPALSAAVAAGLLLALAAPALQLHLAPQGTESFPQSLEVIKTYDRMQQAFPGSALPANVVVKAPSVQTPAMQRAIAQLEQRALASGRAFEPITVDVNNAWHGREHHVPIAGNGTDAASNAAFHVLRDTIVPETVGAAPEHRSRRHRADGRVEGPGRRAEVEPAAGRRLRPPPRVHADAGRVPLDRGRGQGDPAQPALGAAAYGVLVLVFQHGLGKGLLGVSSADGIEAVVPLLLFVILFGLSMDYHVFIISRIRETFDRGAKMDDAVAHGIKSTAGVVTSAAIVMVCVFAVFGTLSMPFFKQFGVGLAAAILIDATIVRGVLLPATMKLLGEWNWYLPRLARVAAAARALRARADA